MQKIKKYIAVLLMLTMMVPLTGAASVNDVNAVSGKKSVTKTKKKMKSGVKVAKVNVTKKKVDVKVKITNAKKKEKYYGEAFYVERYANGQWQKLEYDDSRGDIGFIAIAYVLPKKSSAYKTYHLASVYKREDLKPGKYRICVDVGFKMKKLRCATFRIKE